MVGFVLKSWKLKALALGLCPFFRPGSGFNKESVLKRHPRGCLVGGGGELMRTPDWKTAYLT